jgi:hypothetical protein
LFSATARRATGETAASELGPIVSVLTTVRVAMEITELLKFGTKRYWPSCEISRSPAMPVESVAAVAPVVRFTKTTLFEITPIAWLLSGVTRTSRSEKSLTVRKLPLTVRVTRSIFVIVRTLNSWLTTARRPSELTSTPPGFAAVARFATWLAVTRS